MNITHILLCKLL